MKQKQLRNKGKQRVVEEKAGKGVDREKLIEKQRGKKEENVVRGGQP